MARIGTLTQDQIREINRVNVLNLIRKSKEITKHDLAKQLEISIPTVTTIINALMEEGFIIEAGVAKSTGGRKPVILKFNEKARYAFGVNITPDSVSVILVDFDAKPISEINFGYDRKDGFDWLLDRVEEHIERMCSTEGIDRENVLGVGFSLPGLVEESKLILDNAPNIGVKDYAFGDFQTKIGLKVFIENEANVAAYAEVVEGMRAKMGNVVYISITEGVGTGIIINNQIYKSLHKKAGEFGHMRISDEALRCNCGRTGCWELYASKKALIGYYNDQTGSHARTLEEVFDEADIQDDKVIKAFDTYFERLFIGIENIVLGLNPEYVIIGGELGRYRDELISFMKPEGQLKSAYMEYEGTRIVFSDLKDKGALIGAALLPLQEVFHYSDNVI